MDDDLSDLPSGLKTPPAGYVAGICSLLWRGFLVMSIFVGLPTLFCVAASLYARREDTAWLMLILGGLCASFMGVGVMGEVRNFIRYKRQVYPQRVADWRAKQHRTRAGKEN